MKTINDLLKLDVSLFRDIPLQANAIVDHQLEKVLVRNCRELVSIEERVLVDKEIQVSRKSIDAIVQKVLYYAANDDTDAEWTCYELRIISYYISQLQGDDRAFSYAIQLLDKEWRDLFIRGLAFYVLNTWNLIRPNYRSQVCSLLRKKLVAYKGNIKHYITLSNHADYFDNSGPMRVEKLLLARGMRLEEAPSILGYKPSTIAWSFYSDVIISYLLEKGIANQDEIERIFTEHNIARTKKMVFANLIIKEDSIGDPFTQSKLSRFASKIIGDVSLASTWAPFEGATSEDVEKLRKAKELVTLWFTRLIIDVFFEVCVQDGNRKEFWLNYVDDIIDFRIAGSSLVRRNLQSDSRISGMFARYFIETSSYKSETSALILCIKNKVFVEFSNIGALYVYEHGNRILSFIERGVRHINRVEDLKTKEMPPLVNYWYNPEGRLPHCGEWQIRLRNWMEFCIKHSEAPGMTFQKTPDNQLFKEIPIQDNAPTLRTDYKPKS